MQFPPYISPTMDFWLKIAAIVVPTLLIPLIAYIWFSRRLAKQHSLLNNALELYKRDIGKELKLFEFEIQTSIQRQFYHYQTILSPHHQKQAEVIEHLFELLSKVQRDLHMWATWDTGAYNESKADFYVKTKTDIKNLSDYYDEKRIYLDDEVAEPLLMISSETSRIITNDSAALFIGNTDALMSDSFKRIAGELINKLIQPLMNKLRAKIQQLLSPELPSPRIEKPLPPRQS